MTPWQITDKAIRVIRSVKTWPQLEVAGVYALLAAAKNEPGRLYLDNEIKAAESRLNAETSARVRAEMQAYLTIPPEWRPA